MLKFKDIVRYICATVLYLYRYIKDLFTMSSVYDCARPFMLVAGIFGMGGSTICDIEGVRSVRNTRLSLVIAVLISLIITPIILYYFFVELFAGEQRTLIISTMLILACGQYAFILPTVAMTCIRTHVYCKNLTKLLQILHNTDMMLKRENIHVHYWKIVLKTILFGLISCNYTDLQITVESAFMQDGPVATGMLIVKLFIDIACEIYFLWMILFLLIIRERFVGVNKLLLQHAQVPSIIQDDSLLRRISLARDIHEQLSEAIELISDLSRLLIIGLLVPGMLQSLWNAIVVAEGWTVLHWGDLQVNLQLAYLFRMFLIVLQPIMKTVTLAGVCETHKNNRRVLNARLRHLISREEEPRTVHQLQQYIWFIHDTVAGLVDFQIVDIDFTLLFMVIDILVNYVFVIYSHFRVSKQGETM